MGFLIMESMEMSMEMSMVMSMEMSMMIMMIMEMKTAMTITREKESSQQRIKRALALKVFSM